jgi:hypothetical protein
VHQQQERLEHQQQEQQVQRQEHQQQERLVQQQVLVFRPLLE